MTLTTRCAAALTAVSLAVSSLAGQTILVADAAAFVGTWTMTVDSPQGASEQTLTLTDREGKMLGDLTAPF